MVDGVNAVVVADKLELVGECASELVKAQAKLKLKGAIPVHLVHYLFDFLPGHSQHDCPVCRPSPAPIFVLSAAKVLHQDGMAASGELVGSFPILKSAESLRLPTNP
jgi:hypothetical protein